MFVLIPADVPKAVFVESMPSELAEALRQHNEAHRAQEQIRLRMSLHAGEVYYDEHGGHRRIDQPGVPAAGRAPAERGAGRFAGIAGDDRLAVVLLRGRPAQPGQ